MAQPPNPFEKQSPIPGVHHIVAVSSGKGGVGKSTVAANLAIALSKAGKRVGLLDADIYGPSIPRMYGALRQKPEVQDDRKITPLERYHIKLMSIGFLVDDDLAVIWRGPMLFKAIDQFLREVNWGELDYLIVDLPPGTGDVQLSLVQKVPLSGAVTVTTPQDVALMDVRKSIDMFERVGVPILGMVENMAYFRPPGQTEKVQLFPKGQLDNFLKEKNFEKLAEVPFATTVGLGGEVGIPITESQPDSEEAKAFHAIAQKLIEKLT